MNNFEEMKKAHDEENRENEDEEEIDMELLREIMIFAEMAHRKEMERRSKMRNKMIAAGAIFAAVVGTAVVAFAKNCGRSTHEKTHD